MNYPKRFYKRTKSGRGLKVPENKIGQCRWCGAYFEKKKYTDFCSDYCFKWSEQAGNLLGFNKKKERKHLK